MYVAEGDGCVGRYIVEYVGVGVNVCTLVHTVCCCGCVGVYVAVDVLVCMLLWVCWCILFVAVGVLVWVCWCVCC